MFKTTIIVGVFALAAALGCSHHDSQLPQYTNTAGQFHGTINGVPADVVIYDVGHNDFSGSMVLGGKPGKVSGYADPNTMVMDSLDQSLGFGHLEFKYVNNMWVITQGGMGTLQH